MDEGKTSVHSEGNNMKNKIIALAVLTAVFTSTAALADDVLIVGSYGDAGTQMKSELEAAGHTVTEASSLPADISNIEQIWDLRINNAISNADQAIYDTFLQNSGYLYLAGENSSFATRNNSISAFTSTLGGGAVSVGGSPSNAQDANSTYFSSDTSVDFIAAATITNTGGTGRVLASDSNGNPTGMIWIGNAGDFSSEYNGTVVVIADINWTQSNYYDANNRVFLQELIGGVVAGTVEGTITESGNGGDSNIGGGAPAAPTVTGTAPGTPIVVVTTAPGGTVTTIVTNNAVSETTTEQTVETTTTTTTTVTTNTTTCTTPTTVTTYSDNSTTTANGTESCATVATYASTSADVVDTVSGRIDQSATAQDITNANIRSLEFNGLNGIVSDHTYNNGMNGSTRGFTLGGGKDLENGLTIGGGVAQFNTDVKDADSNRAGASTTVLAGSIEKENVEVSVRHGMTDYTASRNIGPYSNAMSTSGTDTSVSIMFRPETENQFEPVLGYTRGKRTLDGYTEGGDALTSRTVADSSEMYGYATVGGTLDFGLLDVTAIHHTDGVNNLSVGLEKESSTVNWELRLNRTMTDLGDTNSVSAGLQIKF